MRLASLGFVCVWFTSPLVSAAGPFNLIGTASCATSTCHGGVVDRGPDWHHSLSTWVANDPHSGAGLLLRGQDSRAIVHRLAPAAADSPDAYDTVLRNRCISCHVTATSEDCAQGGVLDDAYLARGVSCESCHGAASSWLQPHVNANWAGPHEETGMRDTKSIIGRAETCVRCHIGSRTKDGLIRDMNHDLIAAGHPALRFDLLIYNENLPKHWNESSEVATKFNESAVRVRSVSRAINLAAAARLSAERAGDHLQDSTVPWPELADYDCFACHQSLSMAEFRLPANQKRQRRSPLVVSDGLPIWNSWHSIGQQDFKTEHLKALAPNRADARAVAQQAPLLAKEYQGKADEHALSVVDARALLQQQRDSLQASPPRDWHHAAVGYLRIDAALRDLAKEEDEGTSASAKQILQSIRTLEQLLRFDRDRSDGRPARYHSPAKFDPVAFQKAASDLPDLQPANNTNN